MGIQHLPQRGRHLPLPQHFYAVVVGTVVSRMVKNNLLRGQLTIAHIVKAERRVVVRLPIPFRCGIVRLIAVIQTHLHQCLGIADDSLKVRVKSQQFRRIGGGLRFQIAQFLDQHPKEGMHLAKRHRQLQEPFPCGFVLVSSHQLLNLGKNAIGVIEIRIVQVDQALPYILRFLQNRPALPQRLTVQRKALLALRRDVIPELHMFGKDHDRPPVRYIITSPQNNLLTFAYQHYTIIA